MYKITSDGELLHRRPVEMATTSPVWEWSETEQAPTITDERDDQEFVQSFEDCSLQNILNRYLPDEAKELFGVQRVPVQWDNDDENAVDASEFACDLDTLNAMASQAEELRAKYHLPANMPLGEVLGKVVEKINGNVAKNSGVSGPIQHDNHSDSNVVADVNESATEDNKSEGGVK